MCSAPPCWIAADRRCASDDAHGSVATRPTSAVTCAPGSGARDAVRASQVAATSRNSGDVLAMRRGARAASQTRGSISSAPASTCAASPASCAPRATASIRASTPSRHASRGGRSAGAISHADARAARHAAASASIARAAVGCLASPPRTAADQTCARSSTEVSQPGGATSPPPVRSATISATAAPTAPIATAAATPGRRSTRTIRASSTSMFGQRSIGSGSRPRRSTARSRHGIFEASSAPGPSAAWRRSSSSVGPRYGRSPASASHSATQNAN